MEIKKPLSKGEANEEANMMRAEIGAEGPGIEHATAHDYDVALYLLNSLSRGRTRGIISNRQSRRGIQ